MIKYVIEYVIFFLGFCKVRQLFRYKQIKIATFAFYYQQITFNVCLNPSIFDIWRKALNVVRRKIFKQRELRQAGYGTLKAAIVDNIARLIIVEIGMLAQLRERELVDVQLAYGLWVDGEVRYGLIGHALDLTQLLHAAEPSELLTISHYASGIIAADARHTLQGGGVGGVDGEVLRGSQFCGIFDRVAGHGRTVMTSRRT